MLCTAWLLPDQRIATTRGRQPFAETVAGYRRIMRRREVQLLVGLRLLPTCYWGVATLLVPVLLYRASHQLSTASYFTGISLALAAGCQLLTGRVADRVGRRAPVVLLTSLIVVAAVLTGLFAGSVPGLYASGILGACAAWSLSTLMPGLIKELSEAGEEGRTLALTHLVWSTAMLCGSLAGGALIALGNGLPFLLVGALNVGAVGLAVALLRRGRAPLAAAAA
jgi:MFS family permease